MLQLNAQSKILIATMPADGRKGIDGLAAICRLQLTIDPTNGALFVFCNKSRKIIKILCYDGQGFWLLIKRLSVGRFKWWPTNMQNMQQLDYRELFTLLHNGLPKEARFSKDWKPIT
jgi:transposase